ncbi:PCS3 [Acrasis kona]|uniref:glutathione gamma-glutamylcysteinyltransferase n=1 Tax=Acrasis kona TaxID=1008807 RepID=A0AAW2ZLB5_9EUKA
MNKTTFYRRPLPENCIEFSSPEGKDYFRKALAEGNAEGFFHLIEQFHTQSEPAYCGLGTLAMTLNALGMDPNRLWKGPWRWYSEDLLDCCVPLSTVKQTGVTLEEFQCLALCNGAKCRVYRPDEIACTMEHFRELVSQACSSNDKHLIISYDRRVLGQTGSGHFSPIGCYVSSLDLVLILDVARFKYPPHWVPLTTVYDAMRSVDPATNLSRGFATLSKTDTFVFNSNIYCDIKVEGDWSIVNKFWERNPNVECDVAVKNFVNDLSGCVRDIIAPKKIQFKDKNQTSEEHTNAKSLLFDEVMKTKLYQLVSEQNDDLELNILLCILLFASMPVPVSYKSCCQKSSHKEEQRVSFNEEILSPVTIQKQNYPNLYSEVFAIKAQLKALSFNCSKCIEGNGCK